MESASYLVGGWDSLLTKEDLENARATLASKEDLEKLRTELPKELRAQTWQLAKLVIAAQGVVVAVMGGIGALLRFA